MVGYHPALAARFTRALMAETYHPDVYRRIVSWSDLDDAERWVAAVTRFTRGAYVYRNRVIAESQADDQVEPLPPAVRTYHPVVPGYPKGGTVRDDPTCCPPGYRLTPATNWTWCGGRACPFCHARRMTDVFRALLAAVGRRPDGITVYAAAATGPGLTQAVTAAARRARVAAGGGFSLPTRARGGWGWSAVFISDDKDRLRHRGFGRVVRVFRPSDLFPLCLRVFRYPKVFAVGSVPTALARAERRLATATDRQKTTVVLGAARDDYVPRKGWLDFACNDPKPLS